MFLPTRNTAKRATSLGILWHGTFKSANPISSVRLDWNMCHYQMKWEKKKVKPTHGNGKSGTIHCQNSLSSKKRTEMKIGDLQSMLHLQMNGFFCCAHSDLLRYSSKMCIYHHLYSLTSHANWVNLPFSNVVLCWNQSISHWLEISTHLSLCSFSVFFMQTYSCKNGRKYLTIGIKESIGKKSFDLMF